MQNFYKQIIGIKNTNQKGFEILWSPNNINSRFLLSAGFRLVKTIQIPPNYSLNALKIRNYFLNNNLVSV
jgi:hypothetical protein